ncbi:hypothetical protein BOTBODRAFT_28199 [Botryobasidium botryosum FD-172 SS1]|uniref:Membrane magnesium transporter n=1 Tax=Botryobasidium botryosum (strain FD-172 SS1) TaxID=930990 RepID=A0A067N667_BOTB1|nr:hypothetical protein BOTBODRAFT_28199 [Botryobasidium botryosum FD-172 SS1]
MPSVLGRSLLALSTLILFHAAYSAYEHLTFLKAINRPDESLPKDIVFESLLALLLFTFGAVFNAPPLKEITWASEMSKRSIDEMDSRLGFMSVNHRGKMLFGKQQ